VTEQLPLQGPQFCQHEQKERAVPKAEIEILAQVEITRDVAAIVELDVPKRVLDDPDELHDWVEEQMKDTKGEVFKTVTAAWDITDEDESISYNEVNNLSEE
jgi:hypothetical protein